MPRPGAVALTVGVLPLRCAPQGQAAGHRVGISRLFQSTIASSVYRVYDWYEGDKYAIPIHQPEFSGSEKARPTSDSSAQHGCGSASYSGEGPSSATASATASRRTGGSAASSGRRFSAPDGAAGRGHSASRIGACGEARNAEERKEREKDQGKKDSGEGKKEEVVGVSEGEMDKSMFWTVVKADAVFALCSFTFTLLVTIGIAIWRKRRRKKNLVLQKIEGPRALLIGGSDPKPGHCPLCGRDWPLPGPAIATTTPPERQGA